MDYFGCDIMVIMVMGLLFCPVGALKWGGVKLDDLNVENQKMTTQICDFSSYRGLGVSVVGVVIFNAKYGGRKFICTSSFQRKIQPHKY